MPARSSASVALANKVRFALAALTKDCDKQQLQSKRKKQAMPKKSPITAAKRRIHIGAKAKARLRRGPREPTAEVAANNFGDSDAIENSEHAPPAIAPDQSAPPTPLALVVSESQPVADVGALAIARMPPSDWVSHTPVVLMTLVPPRATIA